MLRVERGPFTVLRFDGDGELFSFTFADAPGPRAVTEQRAKPWPYSGRHVCWSLVNGEWKRSNEVEV